MPTEPQDVPSDWTSRDYRPADGPALYQLWQAVVAARGLAPAELDVETFCQRLGEDWVRVVGAPDGALLGFGAIALPGHLTWLVTAVGAENRGIGTTLLSDLDFLAAAMGAPHITADVPAAAEEFFTRRGFSGSGRMQKRPG